MSKFLIFTSDCLDNPKRLGLECFECGSTKLYLLPAHTPQGPGGLFFSWALESLLYAD